MKLAHSLLLGEHVDAMRVVYGDCARYQITCPNCKEPVFKVERKSSQSSEQLDYFSHYNRDKAYTDVCELRVSAISREEIIKVQATSRDQKLKYFLRIIERALTISYKRLTGMADDEYTTFESYYEALSSSKPVADFVTHLFKPRMKPWQKTLDPAAIERMFDISIERLAEQNKEVITSEFSLATHRRIAQDFWRYILTATAVPGYDILILHGFAKACDDWCRNVTRDRSARPEDLEMADCFIRLPHMSRKGGRLKLMKLLNTPHYRSIAEKGIQNCLDIMCVMIWEAMSRLIVALPYYEMLRAAQGPDEANPFLRGRIKKPAGWKPPQIRTPLDITGASRMM